MSIQLPSAKEFHSLSDYDFTRACFAIHVTASDIPAVKKNSCSIPLGLVAGFAAPGGTLSLQIPTGTNRKLEVFSYLRTSTSESCPTDKTDFAGLDPSQIVRLGNPINFNATTETVELSVTVASPNAADNLLTQYSLANSCAPETVRGVGTARLNAAHQVVSGGAYKIVGTVSGLQNEVLLQGGAYQVRLSRESQ